jgi:hypothetical protein
LYSLPLSKVGSRLIAAAPVPDIVAADYRDALLRLWAMPLSSVEGEECGRDVAMSSAADAVLRDLERWLEPQLKEGEPLAYLAGWGSKLAGAVARLSLILHVCQSLGECGGEWHDPISQETVEVAIALGRDYYLPHARAAFGLMGANERSQDALRVVEWLARQTNCETVKSVNGVRTVSKRDIHTGVFGGSRSAEEVSSVCRTLCEHGYVRTVGPTWRRDSHVFEVNPYLGNEKQAC